MKNPSNPIANRTRDLPALWRSVSTKCTTTHSAGVYISGAFGLIIELVATKEVIVITKMYYYYYYYYYF
jgi:hypothetical protein